MSTVPGQVVIDEITGPDSVGLRDQQRSTGVINILLNQFSGDVILKKYSYDGVPEDKYAPPSMGAIRIIQGDNYDSVADRDFSSQSILDFEVNDPTQVGETLNVGYITYEDEIVGQMENGNIDGLKPGPATLAVVSQDNYNYGKVLASKEIELLAGFPVERDITVQTVNATVDGNNVTLEYEVATPLGRQVDIDILTTAFDSAGVKVFEETETITVPAATNHGEAERKQFVKEIVVNTDGLQEVEFCVNRLRE